MNATNKWHTAHRNKIKHKQINTNGLPGDIASFALTKRNANSITQIFYVVNIAKMTAADKNK